MPTNPSEHFTLEEMIISEAAARKDINNTPGPGGALVHVARDEAELVWDRRPPFNVASD